MLYSVAEGIGIAMKLRDERSGVRIPVGASFFFSKTSRRALWLMQPLVQWVLGFFPEVKVAEA